MERMFPERFTLFKDPINLYFVELDGLAQDRDRLLHMMRVHWECQENEDILPKWIYEDECLNMKPKKSDAFVLPSFEGAVFEQLQTTKCSIFGPQYLLHHLHKKTPIPPDITPVFNTSMQDVTAHLSGYTPTDKLFYHQRITQMSGNICTKPLCPCITHLIFDSPDQITPGEYERARGKGIEVFTKDWIDLVWNTNPVQPHKIPPDDHTIFQGLTFIVGSPWDDQDVFTETDITDFHGTIVPRNYRGIPDFSVESFNSEDSKKLAKEIVTNIYIDNCIMERALVPIEYYHRPINVPEDVKPLKNCVFVISQYQPVEKLYLSGVALELGAHRVETFDRKSKTSEDGYYVTHFICKYPAGEKYKAAVKWRIPGVTGEWLRACVDELRYVDERPFLVESTLAPERKNIAGGMGGMVNMMKRLEGDMVGRLEYPSLIFGNLRRQMVKEAYEKRRKMEMRHDGQRPGRLPGLIKKYKFMISSFKDKDRQYYEQVIKDLGGEVSPVYDESVTHMVCVRPTRSATYKIMACIAGGKWVLHYSYLQDCETAGRFVEEERYEWGNPLNEGIMEQLEDVKDREYADAAYKWRLKVASGVRGVFDGMVAILMVGEEFYDGLERLVRAGGGTVVWPKPLFRVLGNSGKKITHCFIEDELRENEDCITVAGMGISCFSPGFLQTLIFKFGEVYQRDYVIPAFKGYLK